MPHSFGLSAVETSPKLAPLIMLKSPSKSLLYKNSINRVSVRLLQHARVQVRTTFCHSLLGLCLCLIKSMLRPHNMVRQKSKP